jgi:N-acylneuraminate cytidylyltransferase/CMP-N,N'-diacetyllegionaminic acid synthase
MSKVIAIIPARKGSKGVPSKNSKLIAGKPLIAWTIEAALDSKFIDEILVSTNCLTVKKIVEGYGLQVPGLRPDYLSEDETPSSSVILFELENKGQYDVICMLQPTSPLRTSMDIDASFEIYNRSDENVLVSVVEDKHSPYWSFQLQDEYLKSVFPLSQINKRRQDLPKTYSLNGAIYIAEIDFYKEEKSFLTARTIPYIMPFDRSIDIDDIEDFKLAEVALNNLKK